GQVRALRAARGRLGQEHLGRRSRQWRCGMSRPLGLLVIAAFVTLAAPATSAPPLAAGPLDHPGYAKAMTCSACHGVSGNSRSEAVPILAGIAPAYFKKAIEDYASGQRVSPGVEPFAKQGELPAVDEVAASSAAQRREPTPIRADRNAVERGRLAATQCATCHGDAGQG